MTTPASSASAWWLSSPPRCGLRAHDGCAAGQGSAGPRARDSCRQPATAPGGRRLTQRRRCCPLQANLFLLATCYHRSNQSYRAYHLLKGLAGEQSRYLYALCALQLGKLTDAETALLPDNDAKRVGG